MCAPLLIPGINNASLSGKICAITSIHAALWKFPVNTGSDIIFAHYFAYFASISHRDINHFYELRGYGSLIRFYLRTKHRDQPPSPSLLFLSSPGRFYIQRGIIKLIVFRQCQKQYAIGYRVRFNRRNTTSIDASCDISIYRVHREFLEYPGIVNQENTFIK